MTAPAVLTGRAFGRLTVLGPAAKVRHRTAWLCRCECGVVKTILTVYLTAGETKSCGCLHRDLAAAAGRAKAFALAGRVFGRLTVLSRAGAAANAKGELLWLCRCECGAVRPFRGTALTRKNGTRSCGCLRDELRRDRAAAVGAIRRPKICRSCRRPYTAVGPQKECSRDCRRWWRASDESRRRVVTASRVQAEIIVAMSETLEARLTDDPISDPAGRALGGD